MPSKKELMTLESLMYFMAIAENTSKRQTAENIGISIDTLSKYVDHLENKLGTKLLVSNGRGSTMTPEAQKVLDEAQKIKSVLRQLDLYSLEKKEVAGIVRIHIASYSMIYNLLTNNIAEFMHKHPKLSIDLSCHDHSNNLSMLENDISICYAKPSNSELVVIASHNVNLSFCCSPKYISQYGTPKDLEDLYNNHRICNSIDAERFINGWKSILRNFKHIVYNSNTTASTNLMIRSGVGIGLSSRATSAANGLVSLDIEPPLDLNIYIISHKSIKDTLKVRTVIDFIKHNLNNVEGY